MTETRSDEAQGAPEDHLSCCWSPSQLEAFCVFRLKATEEQSRSRAGWGWAWAAAHHQVGGAMTCACVRTPRANKFGSHRHTREEHQ